MERKESNVVFQKETESPVVAKQGPGELLWGGIWTEVLKNGAVWSESVVSL